MNYEELGLHDLWKLLVDGDDGAYHEVLRRFMPLIISESKMNGLFNEDVFQDIREELMRAIQKQIEKDSGADA
jgi:hypothetical protein